MRLALTLIFLLLAPYLTVTAESPYHDVPSQRQPEPNEEQMICEPFGICERCPEVALHQPYCQPFGNRRLSHCHKADSSDSDSEGEIPGWEACGRIIATERADFFEFVICNVVFALLGIFVLFARSRRLADIQARTLAARIGIDRSPAGD